ncbi:MAG: methyltransferase RsmF C-terminal domain-like protein, partial [Segetibacter sp.]
MQQVLPPALIDSLTNLPGFDKNDFIGVHEDGRQVTSIRLNPLKPTDAIKKLPDQEDVPWCSTGRYLSERPSFTLDPVFHGGAYYVQEASSMFLDHIVKEIYKTEKLPQRVLDLCAAPGGKSTLLASALPDSFIVSNEVIKTRVRILAENISKWGSEHVVVTNNDPKDFKRISGYFDLMVVDAPCSGSGLFRKDTDAINEWSEANVQMCSLRQQRILADAIGALKQNGFLVYSTCSYSLK